MGFEEDKKLASRQNDAMERRFSTQKSKSYYKVNQIQTLNMYIYGLIWIYVILSACYLWMIFIGKNSDQYSTFFKIMALIGIILFPYVITPIEMFIVRMGTFVVETIFGNVYKRPDYQYVVDKSYIPGIFAY
jgi:hypothetical protein